MTDDVVEDVVVNEAYLDTSHAAEYLNARSRVIPGVDVLDFNSNTLGALTRKKELKSTRIANSKNYLFKVEWLEAYLQGKYGDEYMPDLPGKQISEPLVPTDVDSTMPAPSVGQKSLGDTAATNTSIKDVAKKNGVLDRIRNSPPLIYASALVAGFATGLGADVGTKFYEFLPQTITLGVPLDNESSSTLLKHLESESQDSLVGKGLRKMVVDVKGPFETINRELRIYLIDPNEFEGDQSKLGFVKNYAAVVCTSSPLYNYRISVKGTGVKGIDIPKNTRNYLQVFHAFLEDKAACSESLSTDTLERVIVNRSDFDSKFRVRSGILEYVDVAATVDLN